MLPLEAFTQIKTDLRATKDRAILMSFERLGSIRDKEVDALQLQ